MNNEHKARFFDTIDVMGAYSGVVLGEIGGIYQVLDYMHGCSLTTIAWPEAAKSAHESIGRQLPKALRDLDLSWVNPGNVHRAVALIQKKCPVPLMLVPTKEIMNEQ